MTSYRDTVSLSTEPIRDQWLVSFSDLTRFARWCEGRDDGDIVHFLDRFYRLADAIIDPAGGMVIKAIGDALLIVFPRDAADAGVQALLELKRQADSFCEAVQFPGRLIIKAHFGEAILSRLGPGPRPPFDIIGRAVNTAAMLPSHGVAITPEAFRRLTPETRRSFKKHTPALRYIPVEEKHR